MLCVHVSRTMPSYKYLKKAEMIQLCDDKGINHASCKTKADLIAVIEQYGGVGCWRGYLSGARCRPAYAQLMPLPLTVSCFSKIQIGFTSFLVPAHPGSPGKRAIKRVCVCVCVCV